MSILKKISILFLTSFILMGVIGFWIDSINSKRVDELIKDKYLKISNEIFQNIDNSDRVEELISKYNLVRVEDKKDREVLYYEKHTFGFISIKKASFEDEFIIEINFLDESYMLKTPNEENINDKLMLNILIFLDIFVLLLIFLYLLKLLSPLKKITKGIENFSSGDFKSRINIKSNDEMQTLSSAFNTMASSLEELIKSREALLRDIGHELRTPIAKGKFVIQKIENAPQKELLQKIFLDLEFLTNELLELEKLNSTKLNLSIFSAETLITEALSKLYISDESSIIIEIEDNFKIEADLHYLSTALKNLIDNALKYATALPITLRVSAEKICVINEGKRLSKELEYYLQPFTQELSQRDGFGLGLSIVNKIVAKHNFSLSYTYEEQSNVFCLHLL
ncbi:MAG: ArsS family sensor histidine kinase [Sulfurimonas sp.]|uniref:ArsS family sensor histidine kinase n=1 Tax=Sulfurimonas sp. TaxID=2022749 RepID=UPI00262960D7|nr:ArsS family sensor histidine kinase [Sulfurimonas sp.]MDD3476855.1 ArsS family sensor histidine kinase [Sulfurimonas sp.]